MATTSTTPAMFGQKAPDFALPATDGTIYGIGDLRGVRGLVVVFICNHCPYVIGITKRLVQDAATLQEMGFGFVAISANDAEAYPEDSFENMKLFAERHRFNFPYLYDADQSVARAYGAVCTPDFFGYDAHLGLQYQGRIDGFGRNPRPDAAVSELVNAMRHVARTGRGPKGQLPSMGCSIKWRAT